MLQFSISQATQPGQQATLKRRRSAALQAKRRQRMLQVERQLAQEQLTGQ
jgi:hypothetical protein